MQFTALVAVAFAALATAAPSLAPRNQVIYATFYNEGAGKAVSVSNPGCLNESGRRSIYYQGGFDNSAKVLIESRGANCPCQNHCDGIPLAQHNSHPFCQSIDLTGYSSVRFISANDCPANNC